jgi:hypothetical protein
MFASIFALLSAAALSAMADTPAQPAARQALTPEERKANHDRLVMERHGGYVTVRGTPSGSIVVVNAQKRVSPDNFDYTAYAAGKWLRGLIKVVDGEAPTVESAAGMKKRQNADFAVFVVEDKSLPPSLIAVEAQWAILNVGALTVGGANDEVVRIRAKNEFARVMTILCGGFCSQYQAPLMNFIVDIPDLDRCLADPPGDMTARMKGYLDRRGVKPERKVFYRKACQEGWAPAPTNEYQKAIWEETRKLPEKPIQIKFDPKKGR